jgi:hypothetical protein
MSLRTSFIAGVTLLCTLTLTGCRGDGLPTDEDFEREAFSNFQTAVAAPDRNFDAYWLGRNFTINGVEFEGPAVGELGRGEGGESLTFGYAAPAAGVCCFGLNVTLYGPAAWEEVKRIRGDHNVSGTTRDVTIMGFPATFRKVVDPPGVIQALVLHVFADDTVIEAVAGAATPLTPSDPQPNPLVHEATFLAVMEQLRPYPE